MRPGLEDPALAPDAPASVPSSESTRAFDEAALAIEAEVSSPMGRADRVAAACERIRGVRGSRASPPGSKPLLRLAELAGRRAGALVEPVVSLLLDVAADLPDPWELLAPLLDSPVPRVAPRVLERAAALAEGGRLALDPVRAAALAARVEAPGSPLAERAALELLDRLLRPGGRLPAALGESLEALYLRAGDPKLRRLAARLLDLPSTLPSPELARLVLGEEAGRALGRYLAFTRATHLDLLELTPAPGTPPPALESIRRAEAACGEALLGDLLATLGWRRVNAGLVVQPRMGVSAGGSFPLLLEPAEAALLDGDPRCRRVFERALVVAHGGTLSAEGARDAGEDPVQRFRGLNLLHADALADILDVAPLSVEKVSRIQARMEAIVRDFYALFSGTAAEECAVVESVYRDLTERIAKELRAVVPGRAFPAELTRLVQMFEDPRNPGEVRTLHGLKRFLHQRGLKLGFRLAETGRGTNRTVDLAVVEGGRVTEVARVVEYVDFEPQADAPGGPLGIPWPAWIAADGFGRQLLHGHATLPKVRAFCYGNEVHYYLAYRNHPLFLRVDFAPPLRGGMLDLEYYGVSKHELDVHPNPSLDGIGRFFRRLDVEAAIETTRIHARYDKERAVDLADLCEKVETLFRLAPYLMDVDWAVGDLALDAGAKAKVAEAWADFFARWGCLPVSQLLTADRLGILAAVETDAAGEREVRWDGEGAYRDRFSGGVPPAVLDTFRSALAARSLAAFAPARADGPVSQLSLERTFLAPLRRAVARGEALVTAGELGPAPPDRFERLHEARLFASLAAGESPALERAARVGGLVSALERHLRFRTTGGVNGYEVQRARLPLRGEEITLFGLRDAAGVVRLGFFTLDGDLHRARAGEGLPWRDNALLDTEVLATRLRRNNLPVSSFDSHAGEAAEAEALREHFFAPNPYEAAPHLPGERAVDGIAAAPGVASGLACLGLEGRRPQDVEGSILVAASLRPEDGPFLARAAGVLSTGGGVLSHAGLLAMQYGRPALVVGGAWETAPGGAAVLACRRNEFEEVAGRLGAARVVERRDLGEREERICEGDLLVLDADAGLLRVLGQDRDALALHDGLRQLVEAGRRLADASGDGEVLALRGVRLRSRHQLERLFSRMEDPLVARHAARELLLGAAASSGRDAADLLRCLLANPAVRDAARAVARQISADLLRRWAAGHEEAARRIPVSEDPWEILALRRDACRLRQRLDAVAACLAACEAGPAAGVTAALAAPSGADLDGPARERLAALGERLAREIEAEAARDGPRLRHLLRRAERLDAVVPAPPAVRENVARLGGRLERADEERRERLSAARVLGPGDGGVELRPLVGSKAAALAEAARLGEGRTIPGWFVVTDRAFREALEAPAPRAAALAGLHGDATLGAVIEAVTRRPESADARSALIRQAWEATPLPAPLTFEIQRAYESLGDGPDPSVAIRSSALEEDTEEEARAGEFDTFLFVAGAPQVLEHLRLAWAGLWTARALHAREALHARANVGGGVLVQRVVDARVSGVLHTVNTAAGRPREMLLNAGLGLGEGVVSGLVAADQVTVEKDAALSGDDLHFRYLTRDKRERVVRAARGGGGTVLAETLYHQRLRPALEYVELCELVHAAARLEAAFGLPLDLEFAIEGAALRLLQVRPVPAAVAVWRETVERWPLSPGGPR